MVVTSRYRLAVSRYPPSIPDRSMTILDAILLALIRRPGKVMTNLDKLDQLRDRLKKTNGSHT
jgi:hypothetical protein